MVAEKRKKLIQEIEDLYDWLDEQISSHKDDAGSCIACGRCCDFESFGHRLYVTIPEIVYMTVKLGTEKPVQMTTSRCPYNRKGKCTVHKFRFSGCRIFCCSGDPDFQSTLSENALSRLKSICTKYDIPYLYTDLRNALNSYCG